MLPTVPWYNGTKHILKLTTATGWDKNKSPPLLLREIQYCHFVPHKGSLVSPPLSRGNAKCVPADSLPLFPPPYFPIRLGLFLRPKFESKPSST